MKNYIILLCIGLATFVFACESSENKQSDASDVDSTQQVLADEMESEEDAESGEEFPDPDATGSFGGKISAEGAVGGAEVLSQLGKSDSVHIKVRGAISACCQAKGCWMTMPLEGEKEMMVKFKDYAFFAPMNSVGKEAIVEGWAFREVVSVDELRHLAEDNNASPEEIEAITKPEERITFMADGLIVENSAEGAE